MSNTLLKLMEQIDEHGPATYLNKALSFNITNGYRHVIIETLRNGDVLESTTLCWGSSLREIAHYIGRMTCKYSGLYEYDIDDIMSDLPEQLRAYVRGTGNLPVIGEITRISDIPAAENNSGIVKLN